MKIIALNGSPRKTWDTATLLNKALEEAKAKQKAEQFPLDCQRALEMGIKLVSHKI